MFGEPQTGCEMDVFERVAGYIRPSYDPVSPGRASYGGGQRETFAIRESGGTKDA
jgi:hypothetical protein